MPLEDHDLRTSGERGGPAARRHRDGTGRYPGTPGRRADPDPDAQPRPVSRNGVADDARPPALDRRGADRDPAQPPGRAGAAARSRHRRPDPGRPAPDGHRGEPVALCDEPRRQPSCDLPGRATLSHHRFSRRLSVSRGAGRARSRGRGRRARISRRGCSICATRRSKCCSCCRRPRPSWSTPCNRSLRRRRSPI